MVTSHNLGNGMRAHVAPRDAHDSVDLLVLTDDRSLARLALLAEEPSRLAVALLTVPSCREAVLLELRSDGHDV